MHINALVLRSALSLVAIGALALPIGGCGGGGSDGPEMVTARFENISGFTLSVSLLAVADGSGNFVSPRLRPGDGWEVSLEVDAWYSWVGFESDETVIDSGSFRAGNALVVFIDAIQNTPSKRVGYPVIFWDTVTCGLPGRVVSVVADQQGFDVRAYASGGVRSGVETDDVTFFEDRAAMVSHLLANMHAKDVVVTADDALVAACDSAGIRSVSPEAHQGGSAAPAEFAERLRFVLVGP